jgi:phosphoglycolate phosphatase
MPFSFDLDGTLADTAPDMACALNRVLRAQGRPAMPFARIRPLVSQGGRALLELGFEIPPDHPRLLPLQQRFLAVYAENVANETQLCPGMATVLARIEACGRSPGESSPTNR